MHSFMEWRYHDDGTYIVICVVSVWQGMGCGNSSSHSVLIHK
jgi:hypothetical protein